MTGTKDRNKRNTKAIIIPAAIIGTVLVIAVVCVCILIHYIHKMNYVPLRENYTLLAETGTFEEDVTNPEEETSSDSSQEEIDEYKRLTEEALSKVDGEYKPIGDVYNILLIGSDTRQADGEGRSDTMMLISVNKTEKKIIATSFLRDLYVKIPEKGYYKINASYAYGGVELLLDTLKSNFSIEIDRYIAVDFYSFVKVVDILGGLDVDVQENELYWLNQYIHASNCFLMKMNTMVIWNMQTVHISILTVSRHLLTQGSDMSAMVILPGQKDSAKLSILYLINLSQLLHPNLSNCWMCFCRRLQPMYRPVNSLN